MNPSTNIPSDTDTDTLLDMQERSWAAGLFDSVVSITVQVRQGIVIQLADPSIERLTRFSQLRPTNTMRRHGMVLLSSDRALQTLFSIQPYVRIKAEHVRQAISWLENSDAGGSVTAFTLADQWFKSPARPLPLSRYYVGAPRPPNSIHPPDPSFFWPYMAGALETKIRRGTILSERLNAYLAWWLFDRYNNGHPARTFGPQTVQDILNHIQPFTTLIEESNDNDHQGYTKTYAQEIDESTP